LAHADFVHLRVHSAYSLSAGAIKVKQLVALCKQHRMPAVAIADTGNLFGALEFAQACIDAGVQPVIGCELGLRRHDGEPRAGRPALPPEPDRIVLLAQSAAGYANLSTLVSRSYLETAGGESPQIDLAALEALSEGLICLSGGPGGPVGRLLGEGQGAAAEALLCRLAAAFPGRLYVELMRHGVAAEDAIEEALVEMAFRHGLPLVATNDCFFPDPSFYEAHDALLCIAEGTVVGQRDRRRLTPAYCFKSAAEMRTLFADLPEACDNTLVVARRCAFMPMPR
jgi:DNA polymerase-3 subunit alpha